MLHHPKVFYPHPDLILQRAEGLGHRRRCCGLSGSGPFWFTHPISPYLSSISSHLTLRLLVTVWRSMEEDRLLRGKGSQKSHKQSVFLCLFHMYTISCSCQSQCHSSEPGRWTCWTHHLSHVEQTENHNYRERNKERAIVEIKKFKEQTSLEMPDTGCLCTNVNADWVQLKL